MVNTIYDVCGIGIGPFNLSLAALSSKKDLGLKTIFLDKKHEFYWHPGLMLPSVKLQVPFIADLVTLADPTNYFSFLNYLSLKNRIYKFYFLEDTFLYRKEYESYCKWAVSELNNCLFDRNVVNINFDKSNALFAITATSAEENQFTYLAKNVVLGIGSTPKIPEFIKHISSSNLFHSSEFAHKSLNIKSNHKVAVIGSGQSAAECVMYLLDKHGTDLNKLYWISRSDGFFPMEASAFGLEHFTPDYMNYFFELENKDSLKSKIINQQKNIYKGISLETLKNIYDNLYKLSITSDIRNIYFSCLKELKEVKEKNNSFNLIFSHVHKNSIECIEADYVVLCTGYDYEFPKFLNDIKSKIETDEQSYWKIDREFKLQLDKPHEDFGNIYIQNGEIHSHGIGAPDLGLGAYRAATIINAICKKSHYNVNNQTAFQSWLKCL